MLRRIDLSRHLLNHIAGENHSRKHRILVGFGIAMIGFLLIHVSNEIQIVPVYYIAENSGLFLHAVGFAPTIDYLFSKKIEIKNSIEIPQTHQKIILKHKNYKNEQNANRKSKSTVRYQSSDIRRATRENA